MANTKLASRTTNELQPDAQDEWVAVRPPSIVPDLDAPPEPIADRIVRIQADLEELFAYYKIESSALRHDRLHELYDAELEDLHAAPFDEYTQEEKVDYLLIQNYLNRAKRTLKLDKARDDDFTPFVEPFASGIKGWIEARMRVDTLDPKEVAASFHELLGKVASCKKMVQQAKPGKYPKSAGFRGARTVEQLCGHLKEMYEFYAGYDPLWDWWIREPYKSLDTALGSLPTLFRQNIAGIQPGDEDTIVGEPIGRDGLLTELEAELIPYSPEELIRLAKNEYKWCEAEMIKASKELGFGAKWHDALEHVKGLVEPPGSQPVFIKELIDQGTAYVKQNDLVSVPRVAEEAIRLVMIPPTRQKVSPFFLGGPIMMVSYPTSDMSHPDKLMSMRGNSRHLSKAEAFHEMIPGHHLQLFMADRFRPYRKLFETPFYIEGWSLYWEMVFWNRGDFFTSPEDRVGTLFWRMHRCARIIFSLKFHLGEMTPAECVDLLVNWVGHERSTAEGEVRRSFNGDYSPLYQAGYLLGALQLWKLRGEVLDGGVMAEKAFHDRVLKANMMPIELLRALILGKELDRGFKSTWRFYGVI
ncbi:hypothetical protein BJ170DRAFT_174600 [Xylariales sp. AK1849]|nr:hypothetical protein BJ170DRAFT_174600 [Xylariales sp. AK1849]